ncbi:Nuclear transcription factor Y subunit B-3 [Hibiscus syriacus]|uniref:Nuclear transcription factor Y subunit B-3 n=1 Tax=Hibiscus syriacus TaxID=106335 RepID=A0A6A3CBT1_HIBSY|nr:Nuclear transcription factor Y subunit B-3 [Hibiscus syriacus]
MGPPESGVSNPRVADGVERGDSMVSHESQGFRGSAYNDVKGPNAVIGGGGGRGLRVELAQASSKLNDMAVEQSRNNNYDNLDGLTAIGQQGQGVGNVGGVENEGLMRQGEVGAGNGNVNSGGGSGPMIGNGVGNVAVASVVRGSAPGVGGSGGGTILFVGDLHWWTTDAELESELCKYGPVKEVKFFDEKASGKSKGYCQVEFYDPAAATACKEGMNGHVFNGRPCVVAFASPFTVKKRGEAQLNRKLQMAQSALSQAGRGRNDAGSKPVGINIQTGGNYQGGDNNKGYGRGNMGRGNAQGMGNRGPVGPMRNRAGGMGGRGIMGNGGNGFGQGIGAAPDLMHTQSMMGQGFGPAFGGAMGRMGGYGGFPGALTSPFSGMLNSFPPVGGVGLPGVAPHVNPAFFGRGMSMNGMGMMPSSGVDGPNMGWSDPSMGGWGGDEHGGGRASESSYGEEAAFNHQHGEASHDRGGNDRDMTGEKDTGNGHDWPERQHQDDRDIGRECDRERDRDQEHSRDRDRNHDRELDQERDQNRYREDKDRYAAHHKYRDREPEHSNDWDRGRSSRTHSKSRLSQEEEHRSRSRGADYGKRRRLTSD